MVSTCSSCHTRRSQSFGPNVMGFHKSTRTWLFLEEGLRITIAPSVYLGLVLFVIKPRLVFWGLAVLCHDAGNKPN